MNRSRRLLLAAAIFGAATFGSTHVNATDVDIDATLTVSAAVSVVKDADLDFGAIDFVAVHNGDLQVGPDGNAALTNVPAGLTLTGTPVAGQMTITSGAGIIDVTCDAAAVIGDGSTDLAITEVKWDVSAATYGAAANTCGGLGLGVISLDTGATANPIIYIGAQLVIGANALVGSSGSTPFDTSTGGGDPITFRMVFQ